MTEQKPAEAVPAATMLLVRDEPEFQVLMVKRHHQKEQTQRDNRRIYGHDIFANKNAYMKNRDQQERNA